MNNPSDSHTNAQQPRLSQTTLLAVFIVVCTPAMVGLALFGYWRFNGVRTLPPVQSDISTIPAVAIDIPDDDPDLVGLIAKLPANPGYLGLESCSECHAERVAEFKISRHFQAMCRPEPELMPIGFTNGHRSFASPDTPVWFEMTSMNHEFAQSVTRAGANGRERISTPISFVFGSRGGNDEVYFAWHGDRLFELPSVWIESLKTWGTSPFDHFGTGDLSRDTTPRCIECHNTWFEHMPGSRNQYGHDHAILGVTCEVCHGPGSDHVAHHKKSPNDQEPYAVVRPAKLPRERLMDLCAQCHSNALKHRGPAFSYRPGQPLEDYYYTYVTKFPEDDHVANQTTSLRQSKCFQKSDTMTCVTCHDPHVPRSHSNAGAASCLQCHQSADCKDQVRIPEGVRDDCVGCHMPESRKIQVNFRTETDRYVAPVKRFEHRIAVYDAARSDVLLKWHQTQNDPVSRDEAMRLSKSLGTYWREESEKRERQYRFLAAIDACRESIHFDPTQEMKLVLGELLSLQSRIDEKLGEGLWHVQGRRYQEAIAAFEQVLSDKPDHPTALGKLGTMYAAIGNKTLGYQSLKKAAESDPNDPYPTAMLGWLAYLDDRYDEALEFYRRADAVEPYAAQIKHQMGLVYIKQGRRSEAVTCFKKSLEADPNYAASAVALSQVMRSDQSEEAVHYAKLAVRLTRGTDPEVLMTLAETYADLKQWSGAIKFAEKAIQIPQPRQPQRSKQIQDRISEFKRRLRDNS